MQVLASSAINIVNIANSPLMLKKTTTKTTKTVGMHYYNAKKNVLIKQMFYDFTFILIFCCAVALFLHYCN